MKRWDLYDDGLEPRDNGGWVLYRDHVSELAAVTAERDALRETVERCRGLLVRCDTCIEHSSDPCDSLLEDIRTEAAAIAAQEKE